MNTPEAREPEDNAQSRRAFIAKAAALSGAAWAAPAITKLPGSYAHGSHGGIQATGGTESEPTGEPAYIYHTFNESGDFVVSSAPEGSTVEYFLVGGGGGGGGVFGDDGGGGGGGDVIQGSTSITAGTYPVTVGAGGLADSARGGSTGEIGGPSRISFPTAVTAGGGGGGSGWDNLAGEDPETATGFAEGAATGGGGGSRDGHRTGADGGPTGGDGGDGGPDRGGGGGGAATSPAGDGQHGDVSGNGGPGTSAPAGWLTEYPTYGGGGGGGSGGTPGSGTDGGGAGGGAQGQHASTLYPNRGGGGGGAGTNGNQEGFGGDGAAGVVIIRYRA